MKHKRTLAALLMLGLLGLRNPSNMAYGSPKTTPETKKYTLEFHTFNDNTGVESLDKVLSGDDFGYTWGLKVGYGIDSKERNINFDYIANLYTQRRTDVQPWRSEKGEVHIPQKFLDEVLLNVSVDNKGKTPGRFYQECGFGALYLGNCNDDFFLCASSQQILWHKFLSNFVPTFIPDNQESESESGFKLGMVFSFHQGLYLPLRICNWLNLDTDLKFGARISTIPDTSYLDLSASSDLVLGKKGKSLAAKLSLGSDLIVHDNGAKALLSLGSSVRIKNFETGINFIKPFGDTFSIYQFDDKRNGEYDLIGEGFVKLKF